MSTANQCINGFFLLLLIGIDIQPGTEKGFNFLPLVRVVRQRFLPILLGNPLFIEDLFGTLQTISFGNTGMNNLFRSITVIGQMKVDPDEFPEE